MSLKFYLAVENPLQTIRQEYTDEFWSVAVPLVKPIINGLSTVLAVGTALFLVVQKGPTRRGFWLRFLPVGNNKKTPIFSIELHTPVTYGFMFFGVWNQASIESIWKDK